MSSGSSWRSFCLIRRYLRAISFWYVSGLFLRIVSIRAVAVASSATCPSVRRSSTHWRMAIWRAMSCCSLGVEMSWYVKMLIGARCAGSRLVKPLTPEGSAVNIETLSCHCF